MPSKMDTSTLIKTSATQQRFSSSVTVEQLLSPAMSELSSSCQYFNTCNIMVTGLTMTSLCM